MPWVILVLVVVALSPLLPRAQSAEPWRSVAISPASSTSAAAGSFISSAKEPAPPVVILETGLRNRGDIWSVKPDAGEAVYAVRLVPDLQRTHRTGHRPSSISYQRESPDNNRSMGRVPMRSPGGPQSEVRTSRRAGFVWGWERRVGSARGSGLGARSDLRSRAD